MPVEVTETEPQTEPDAEDDQQVFFAMLVLLSSVLYYEHNTAAL
jgi:hypothetical protein